MFTGTTIFFLDNQLKNILLMSKITNGQNNLYITVQ
jgi:hypothetical protein